MSDLAEFIKLNMEIHRTTKARIDQLESELKALQQRVADGPPTFGPFNWTLPKGPSDFPFGIKWTGEDK